MLPLPENASAVLRNAEEHMKKTLQHLQHELLHIRAGKATPELLDGIRVEYYGTSMAIQQLASISTPDARLIVVQPWDKGAITAIERAIQSSGLGLNPSNDGNVIRIPIPPLTEERRRELVKRVKRIGEDAKVAVRNIRREAIEEVRALQKEAHLPEDLRYAAEEEIQKLTNRYIERIDQLLAAKEKEILEV
ncbi:MAG: ribosome recycling factor [Bacteroidetes bacterium]|nr:ribosome recycling factor [Rhodothermia bacterium]MCS7155995.1 ribosome recycling factor [Bacteroidota bacterium]MCX7907683.1 ribosome recycling factor [Bacteroidota bacterium]MDW8137812.1 ribosome recycling factor [Bacteroidota bacterium]MDW8286337.1 ribosome recycling factor [Bacteroidota bacterium]